MKVLLTGANGFVGSRILQQLAAGGIPAVILLRPTGSQRLIQDYLDGVEIRPGSLEEPATLAAALEGVSHVIHCAGKTKAVRRTEFAQVNVAGTQRLLDAVQARAGQVQRLVYLSSLAACGPGTTQNPAREDDPPHPVSAYGHSKLAAERLVWDLDAPPRVVLRPGAVYGPGDADFLELFQTARRGFIPQFGGGRQPLNLVYADDLARLTVRCLTDPRAVGRTFHVAHPQPTTARELGRAVAAALGVKAKPVSLPLAFLVPISWGAELVSRLTGRPSIVSVDRRRLLTAPGWVCDTSHLRVELGWECETNLEEGLRRTAAWYQEAGWLPIRR
jgi:nucleoside-diphosphate-sugar epimerase